MNVDKATTLFDALSQETRLRVFRLLLQAGSAGLPAGALSDALDVPHNTLSFHLNHLTTAGILTSRKEGRSVIYNANFATARDLVEFLVADCCTVEFASIRKDSKTGRSVIEFGEACHSP